MKKEYISPEFELIDISTAEFLLTSSTEDDSAGDDWLGDGDEFGKNDGDEW